MSPPDATIRGYELIERIGAGAESVIYKARDIASDEIVAVKHVVTVTSENTKYLRHIENEYRNLVALQTSPKGPPEGIVKVFELRKSGRFRRRKERVLSMEYVNGVDLRKERRYPMGQMVHILTDVANALAGLHARGMIHADLKPENIVVEPSGKPTIVDFGFSCPVGSRAMSIRGTRDYIAPEQLDMGHLNEKTDIYNLGATMYFLFVGRHVPAMLATPGDSKLFIGSRNMPVPRLCELDPRIPAILDDMVLRCVRKDPNERPSCVEEVRDVLQEVSRRHFS
jgi:serine/threonine-protein kinase